MSSAELDLNGVMPQLLDRMVEDGMYRQELEAEGSSSSLDRDLETAREMPSHDTLPALVDPTADHEDADLVARRADVDEKHKRIIAYLDRTGYDAVLLGRADSLAWFTSGGEFGVDGTTEAASAWLIVNRRCRSLVADNVQSARLFEEEVAGLGFQLKEWSWYEDPNRMIKDLTFGKKVATDCPSTGLILDTEALRSLRNPLSPLERQRLRLLGRTLAVAVESTSRNFHKGENEAHIAGHLAHRLLRQGVTPVSLRVAGDDRLARFRQPTFKAASINHRATIAAVGQRQGLCAAVTRTVSFGPVDEQFRAEHVLATMVDATCIYFSRPGEPLTEVFRRARRIYEKFGRPHEWTLDYQGAQIGYSPRELVFRPDCPATMTHGMAVCWSPSVGSARSEDTVVVDDRGFEVVTEAQNWPKIEVQVKGFPLPRPGILER